METGTEISIVEISRQRRLLCNLGGKEEDEAPVDTKREEERELSI